MNPSRKNIVSAYLAGILYGLIYAADGYFNTQMAGGARPNLYLVWLPVVYMPTALRLLQLIIHDGLIDPLAKSGLGSDFYRYEPYTYLVFGLSAGFIMGITPSIAFTLGLLALLILSQAVVFIFTLDKVQRRSLVASEPYIPILFLVSGFSALIYQVVWQRVLFTTFGVNSESVTVIVSVFMFGLGVGALAGGYLQKKYPAHLLPLFVLLEISIGLFGLFSLDLIRFVSHISASASPAMLVLRVYAVLALPTLMMGATLPILVAFLQRYLKNIGKTVGLLYAFNTIGSAVAAFYTVTVLFVFAGLHTTVLIATACNFATAYLIFDASRKLKPVENAPSSSLRDDGVASPLLPYAIAFLSLMAIGYISLSQEILWFRLLGYMTANRPQVFGLLLAAFLLGIASGSLRSKKICESGEAPYGYLVRALFFATAAFYLAVPIIAYITSFGTIGGVLAACFAIGLVAFFTGGILPILIHVGTANKQTNSTLSMSWLYFANIIGATLGPLLTGFILLDRFSLESNIVIVTGLTSLLLLGLLWAVPKAMAYKLKAVGVVCAMALSGWLAHAHLYQGHLEKIQYTSNNYAPFKHRLENRDGIITVEENASNDIMYGNGIYDGRFNTDPLTNSNLIDRAFMIAALHRKPQRILEIGLSTGSWTKIISDYQPLQELTVVEINRGYPELIAQYPEIAPILENPKIKLVFDDGRRWLRNHPDEKFDFIVMNTTYYWRSNATNLLSKEFLELCKRHLNKNGVIYYNTTGSADVIFTAAHVFEYVATYSNFVAASDSPFDMTAEEKRNNLLQFRNGAGEALFNRDELHLQKLNQLSNVDLKNLRKEMLINKKLWLITDDNMAVEYKVP